MIPTLANMTKILLSLFLVTYSRRFDKTYTELISFCLYLDWYHDSSYNNLPSFMTVYNPTGAEPVPRNILSAYFFLYFDITS